MKVLLNALSARRGGSRVFVTNLVPALAALDSELQILVILPESEATYFPVPLPSNVTVLHSENVIGVRRLFYEHLRVPLLYAQHRCDCYFQADDTLPPLIYPLARKSIAVFHETLTLLLPKLAGDSMLKLGYWRLLKSLALKWASVPVAMSYCEKGELARGNGKVFRKTRVIYHGIDVSKFHCRTSQLLADAGDEEPKNLPSSFILSVSTRNPHKNYYRVVKAYALLRSQGKINEHLVLIGSPVWASEEKRIQQLIETAGISEYVHLFDKLDNKLLPAVYQRARAYVYASLYDSFGFTPLEAMACGVPCAVSRFSALPEICGSAAEYFDPFNVEDMAEAIANILNNEDRRRQLISSGLEQSSQFSWQKAAQQYHSLLTADMSCDRCV
ncbi:glycosyltransferase family 4 protein [Geomonas limicola]|uniref:glycosyltransferase family 4 protein n=1 Tax=Geomonas limicola TaxID=2740186 RepID=UPI00161ED0F4|nr:glycosyltransferase family 1 protein [Geomonas limicola]